MLIPDNLTSFDSNGELIMYNKFKNDPVASKYIVLHSLFTGYHLKSISGEADFLVMVPGQGIFFLEIKHGRVKREGGYWHFTNRLGRVSVSSKGPFRQVSDTMHSVRDYILKKLPNDKNVHNRFSKILFGYGVVFTSMEEMPDFGTEGQPWQVLNRHSIIQPVHNCIKQLSDGWHHNNRGKTWYDGALARPSENDCQRMLEIIRGDFDTDYSLLNRTVDHEYLIEEFTREQFKILDFVNYNERAVITGDAGTGKTLMALEIAGREFRKGKNICLICYNQKLGKKLQERVRLLAESTGQDFYAGSLHSFLLKSTGLAVPAEPDQDFFSEVLPFEFLLSNEDISEQEKYDLIIVDEFQDLTDPSYLEIFNTVLKGGLKSGKWIFFGDFCKQAIYSENASEVFTRLHELTGFIKFPPLTINCRNTRRIAIQNTLMSGSSFPELRSNNITGDKIFTAFPSANKVNKEIAALIEKLNADGIPPEKITILSPRKLEHTGLVNSGPVMQFINQYPENFSTIHAFKGLENTVIILTGFDELTSELSQKLLYVAISRARVKLFIVMTQQMKGQYEQLIAFNSTKITR